MAFLWRRGVIARLRGSMAFYVFLAILATSVIPLVAFYVFVVSISSANTELSRDKAEIIVKAIEGHVRQYLDIVPIQAKSLANLLREGKVTFSDHEQIGELFTATLGATPQVATLSWASYDGQIIRVFRSRPNERIKTGDWSDELAFTEMLKLFEQGANPSWEGIFFAEAVKRPFMNYVFPLSNTTQADNQVDGVLIASVSLEEFSSYLQNLKTDFFGTPFILRERTQVLAHPQLPDSFEFLSDARPLPALQEVGDPALVELWSDARIANFEAKLASSIHVRVIESEEDPEVFLYQETVGYDRQPWIIGIHLPLSAISDQLNSGKIITLITLIVVAVALMGALLLSRMLTSPIRRLDAAAKDLGRLDFERGPSHKSSLFREVDEVLDSLESARRNLQFFGRYVPKALVRKLISQKHGERELGNLAEVTILFTDIVGFTAMSEEMSAHQIEQFLNKHFSLLTDCVAACDGTTDKYIGDSLMAFWGAPETQPQHAYLACRAAAKIARVVEADNDQREDEELPRVKVRMGIHSGSAIVGDIGSSERVNYTVVGDTVNVAQRLEDIARQNDGLEQDRDVIAVISKQTATQAGHHIRARSLGRSDLHGRKSRIEAMVLEFGSLGEL
jgi:class 3 adenylate cyclase